MPKRARGEGTLRKRVDGRWEAVLVVGRREDGKLKTKSFYGKTPEEAAKKRDAFLADVREGTYVEPNKLTFGAWVKRWLDVFVKPNVAPTTWDKYSCLANKHVIPCLGAIPLQKLTTDQIQEFYNAKAAHLASSTVAVLHQIVIRSLKQAVKQRLVRFNPAENTAPPPVRHKEILPMGEKEVEMYLEAARTEKLYPAFLLLLATALRRGELLALRWKDVDLDRGVLHVRQTLIRRSVGNGKTRLEFTDPKTEASKREIPLLPSVCEILKQHKAAQDVIRVMRWPDYQDLDLVFATSIGTPIEPRDFLRLHKAILKRAGLREDITVHTLRHTVGTLLANSGENPETIQKLLGHTNVHTTLSLYCHSNLEDKRRAVERLSRLVAVHQKQECL